MTRGKQTIALALTGAVALASGAYALGTQADDGNAAAAKTPQDQPGFAAFGHRGGPGGPGFGHGFRGGPGGPRFDGLADRLGVSEDKLRAALEDIAKTRRDDFAATLAAALGIDRAKVEAAFDKLRPKRPDHPRAPEAFAAALAKQLGLTTAKVRAALENHRGRPTSPDQLAKELGVSEEKLRDAFHAVMGKLRPHGPGGRPGFDGLAKALGVTQQQLDDAFAKLRADHEKLEDEFASELAKRLGLDASKVKEALEESRPFPPRQP
jgi:biotin operon repressor